MCSVWAAICATTTLVADDAIVDMLWCSAYQILRYPPLSASRARATLAAKLSPAVSPLRMGARSRIERGVVKVFSYNRFCELLVPGGRMHKVNTLLHLRRGGGVAEPTRGGHWIHPEGLLGRTLDLAGRKVLAYGLQPCESEDAITGLERDWNTGRAARSHPDRISEAGRARPDLEAICDVGSD
jgi:hypothetical protein